MTKTLTPAVSYICMSSDLQEASPTSPMTKASTREQGPQDKLSKEVGYKPSYVLARCREEWLNN